MSQISQTPMPEPHPLVIGADDGDAGDVMQTALFIGLSLIESVIFLTSGFKARFINHNP